MYKTIIFKDKNDADFVKKQEQLEEFLNSINEKDFRPYLKGDELTVSLLDSGIDIHHPELLRRYSDCFNSLTKGKTNPIDRIGHGSFNAGIITKMLPNSKFYSIKITDDYGKLNAKTINNGLRMALNLESDLIIAPIGGYYKDDEMMQICIEAEKRNAIIVASAGNSSGDLEYPGRFKNVISIGSVDYLTNHQNFSVLDERLDYVMPGVNIPSCYSFKRYAYMSGSSPSTSISGGIIGKIMLLYKKKYKNYPSVNQLRRFIKDEKHFKDLGEIGIDEKYGKGMLIMNREKTLEGIRGV